MGGGGEVNDAGAAAPAPAGGEEGQEQEIIVAQINTYAKGKDVTYDVVVLKNGKVANMNILVRPGPIRTRRMIKFGEIIGELDVDNSWNNRHAKLMLNAADVLAVVRIEEKRGVKYELVHGDGELVAEYEETRDDEDYVVRTDKVLYYVHTDGKKHRVAVVDSYTTPILKVKRDGDRIIIRGNTYPVKDDLKRLGARWVGGSEWILPAAKAELLQQLDAIVEEA